MPSSHYHNVEVFPELAEVRAQTRYEAWEIVDARQQQIQAGYHEDIPLAVDALSTAARVQDAGIKYGYDSAEYIDSHAGLVLDCHRLVTEWRRKNRPEYFPKIQHHFDDETGSYYSHGASVWVMTEDALTPSAHHEETERRVNERVEEATAMKLRALGGLAIGGPKRMRTVSECTDWAIEALQDNNETGYGGYVPEIQKLMVRDMIIDPATGSRFQEQMGLPGTFITHDVVQRALERRGVNARNLDKTQLHGTQLLVEDDLIDFVQLLDEVASEEWCTTIFRGEEVSADHPRDYGAIREEAVERQKLLADQSLMVADFVISLQETGTDPSKAPEIIEEFVKRMLLVVARDDTGAAIDMFDNKTAVGLQQVAYLQNRGQVIEALDLFNQVVTEAPGGGYCGAGSCGLEQASYDAPESDDIKALGFDVKDTLLDKGGRKCKNCDKKLVVYDLKKSMKGCLGCKATAKY